jgi:hypothetical protein
MRVLTEPLSCGAEGGRLKQLCRWFVGNLDRKMNGASQPAINHGTSAGNNTVRTMPSRGPAWDCSTDKAYFNPSSESKTQPL